MDESLYELNRQILEDECYNLDSVDDEGTELWYKYEINVFLKKDGTYTLTSDIMIDPPKENEN